MSVPSIKELKKAAEAVVIEAKAAGRLTTTTKATVRRELEKRFKLKTGTLNGEEYKEPLGNVVEAAVQQSVSEDENEEDENVEEEDDSDDDVDPESSPPPRKKAKTEKSKSVKKSNSKSGTPEGDQSVKSRKPKVEKTSKFKSAAEVVDSDDEMYNSVPILPSRPKEHHEEQGGPPPQPKPKPVLKQEAKDTKPSPKQPKSAPAPEVTRKPAATTLTSKKKVAKQETKESDSEVSDSKAKPKRKRASNGKEKEKSTDKGKKASSKTKPTEALSKDEETIKRLKSFAVACGVRKVWSKFFDGVDAPSQQIKMLRQLLADLGMTGRLSMEQAKSIKEKRDLEQELEDVRNFEKSTLERSSRTRSTSTSKKPLPESNDAQSDSSLSSSALSSSNRDTAKSRKKAMSARKSIMAFLGDQSDDED